jgi:hypothetical protein
MMAEDKTNGKSLEKKLTTLFKQNENGKCMKYLIK